MVRFHNLGLGFVQRGILMQICTPQWRQHHQVTTADSCGILQPRKHNHAIDYLSYSVLIYNDHSLISIFVASHQGPRG